MGINNLNNSSPAYNGKYEADSNDFQMDNACLLLLNEIDNGRLRPLSKKKLLTTFVQQLFNHQTELLEFSKSHPGFRKNLEEFSFQSHSNILWKEALKPLKTTDISNSIITKEQYLEAQKRTIPSDARRFAKNEIEFLYNTSPNRILETLERRKSEVDDASILRGIMQTLDKATHGNVSSNLKRKIILGKRSDNRKFKEAIQCTIDHFLKIIGLLALEKQAEQAAQELLAEEASASRTKTNRKRKPKIVKSKGIKASPKQPASSAEKTSPIESPEQGPADYLARLQSRASRFKIAPRVRRWETRDLEKIRAFADKGGKKHYAKMTSEELFQQRSCHHFPDLHKIFSHPIDRQKYTCATTTGVVLMARQTRNGEAVFGRIYYGLDSENIIFHCQFVPFSEQDSVKTVFGYQVESSPCSNSEADWQTDSTSIFHMEGDETIRVEYPDEDYEIAIFPIQKGSNN